MYVKEYLSFFILYSDTSVYLQIASYLPAHEQRIRVIYKHTKNTLKYGHLEGTTPIMWISWQREWLNPVLVEGTTLS